MNSEIHYYLSHEYDGDLSNFDCGFPVFNEYLQHKFLNDGAAIHYVINSDYDSLVAYFSLLATSIFLEEIDETIDSNMIPAIELKMIALDKEHRKSNLSERLLADVYDLVVEYLNYVGAKALILYSVPIEKVVQIYERHGFSKMPDSFTMYKSEFNQGCVPMYQMLVD